MKSVAPRVLELVLRFRRVLSIVAQLGLVVLSNRLAFVLRFDQGVPGWADAAFLQMLPWLIAIRGLSFVPFRLYEGLWRYTSIYDLQMLLGGILTSSIVFAAVSHSSLGPAVYPRSVYFTDAIILTVLLGGLRLTRRVWGEYSWRRPGQRVLVFGAGDAGELIVRDMKSNAWFGFQPIGFVDDDRTKVGRRIHGVPVLGTRQDLDAILEKHHPDEILIAIPKAESTTVRSIVRALEPFKIPIKTLPNLREIIDGRIEVSQIRNLSVEDLLARAPIGLDRLPLKILIEGRRVMVTGAGGSIGSELCRQIARLRPASLAMLERHENSLHAIRLELQDDDTGPGIVPVIADVTDAARVNDVLALHRPEIIFHAAAHKHVPLMEENPCEAIKNNVSGTRILVKAAEEHGVDRFIFISTDKAVNPTSVMGASKRVCELIVQAQAVGSGTSFSIVRFGNVLGSSGSVIPRFIEQIRRGGPVTITDPAIKRFFMLIPDAVQLVLHAAAQAESGATYVLEMGEQVKLLDMARDLIRLSGLVPEDDIKIVFIGLRPGEKLYEELVGPSEDVSPSQMEKILCVRSRCRPSSDLALHIEHLEANAVLGRADLVRAGLRQLAGISEGAPAPSGTAAVASTAVPRPFISDHDEHPCPKCPVGRVRRSRVRALREKVYKRFTAERPYRCPTCGWRGWLVPLDFGEHRPIDPVQKPDLASLDSAIRRLPVQHPSGFSPRDLS